QVDSVGVRWLDTYTASSALSNSNPGSQPIDFENLLTNRLLSNVEYVQRIPDFVISLSSHQLVWPQVYECLLGGLAHPISSVDGVAELLLMKGAPSQVLLLSGTSLDYQKRAIEE